MGIGYRHFGFLSFGEGDGLRFTWLQIVWKPGFALELNDWGPDRDRRWRYSVMLGIGLFFMYLDLPFLQWWRRELSADGKNGFGDMWGFSYRIGKEWDSSLSLRWGGWYKNIPMPWAMTWVRTSYLLDSGKRWPYSLMRRFDVYSGWWFDETTNGQAKWEYLRKNVDPIKWRVVYPYRYTLKNGEIQDRQATVTVEEREWRRRGWKWCKVGRKVSRTISVEFDKEVGERSGSWKGGVTGCSYELRPNETPLDCLRRMQRERKL